MEKKNIKWNELGFAYMETDSSYQAIYKEGAWQPGGLTQEMDLVLSQSAQVLHYGQAIFEGMKVYEQKDGSIVSFRPDQNASRMQDSARGLAMPAYSEEDFLKGLDEVVKDNAGYVPPYGTGASLYIRPFMVGTTAALGVNPAQDYVFRIMVSPVGPYYKGGIKPISIVISDYDRAAPHGTGNIKAALNYAMSMKAKEEAVAQGFQDVLFLDAATRTKVEEASGANIIFIKGNKVITPKSNSILPSVTRRSLLQVAQDYLGMEVEEREVKVQELGDFEEAGLCGTAAVISPLGKITYQGRAIELPSGMDEIGPGLKKLYDTLTGIQLGDIEAPQGWIRKIL